MVNIIPITKARINLGSIVKKVRVNKEYFVLEKDGYPVAGIMDIDEFEDYLDLKNPAVNKLIKKSAKEYRRGKAGAAPSILKKLKNFK